MPAAPASDYANPKSADPSREQSRHRLPARWLEWARELALTQSGPKTNLPPAPLYGSRFHLAPEFVLELRRPTDPKLLAVAATWPPLQPADARSTPIRIAQLLPGKAMSGFGCLPAMSTRRALVKFGAQASASFAPPFLLVRCARGPCGHTRGRHRFTRSWSPCLASRRGWRGTPRSPCPWPSDWLRARQVKSATWARGCASRKAPLNGG